MHDGLISLDGAAPASVPGLYNHGAVMASGLFDVEETGGCWDHDRFRDAGWCPCILAGDGLKTNLAARSGH